MEQKLQPSEIVTFYSFKGGTGRTMALANLAILTARLPKKVLLIDWDLEAPGLHRYFSRQLPLTENDLNAHPGLIDYFYELQNLINADFIAKEVLDDADLLSLFTKINFDKYLINATVTNIILLKAGAFTDSYPKMISEFHWENFYKKAPSFFKLFGKFLKEQFDFIFIDSRTGFTDTSGICTMLMPEKLCLVFTPNKQSLDGVKSLAVKALEYRMNSSDFRALKIYPIPSRVELAEKDLREQWRKGTTGKQEDSIEGFQPVFEKIFNEYYGLNNCDLSLYFDQIQIHHEPKYSYGESLAVLNETYSDRLSLSNVYSNFLNKLLFEDKIYSEKADETSDNKDKIRLYISAAKEDAHFVVDLRKEIEKAKSFFIIAALEEDIMAGEDFLKRIEENIINSQVFIPIVSQNYLSSKFGDFELYAFSRNITSTQTNMAIPVYLDSANALKISSNLLTRIPGISFDRKTGSVKDLAKKIIESINANSNLKPPGDKSALAVIKTAQQLNVSVKTSSKFNPPPGKPFS
ncbi:MAG TPA: TIR domain-containing protein [Chitinophagaceae bacterium]|nr:TIR domain-containing protein [Chitinophagaceae bacterium]